MSEDAEIYLGGFYMPIGISIIGFRVPYGLTGSSDGAGIYATDKRLFVLGHGKATFPSNLNKIAHGSGRPDFVPSTLTKDQNDAIIAALTENKMFEFNKVQISQIEVKKPSGFLRRGWLKITIADGHTMAIRISLGGVYEWAVSIVQTFKPEAVTLEAE